MNFTKQEKKDIKKLEYYQNLEWFKEVGKLMEGDSFGLSEESAS